MGILPQLRSVCFFVSTMSGNFGTLIVDPPEKMFLRIRNYDYKGNSIKFKDYLKYFSQEKLKASTKVPWTTQLDLLQSSKK